MAVEVLVLADDLTGANDAGAQCARLGVRSVVTTDVELSPEGLPDDIAVVVIDTESRHDTPDQAHDKVARIARRFYTNRTPRLFKKTDSTLRGNIGAELDAALSCGPFERLLFMPAYPAAGRMTVDGHHYVDGQPVHESPYGHDPRAPVSESFVPALLAKQTELDIAHTGPAGLMGALARMAHGILIVDASAEDEIRAVAERMHVRGDTAFAGPVGVLAELLPRWGLPAKPLVVPHGDGPLLIVNGSLNEVSLRQCAWARLHGFTSVRMPAEALVNSGCRETVAVQVADRLRAHEDVTLFTVENVSELYDSEPGPAGLPVPEACGEIVARALALLDVGPSFALCIFGGETSHAVLERIGCVTLYPCAYLGDGLSAACVSACSEVAVVVTKSGGFGPENVAGAVRDWVRAAAGR
ncbi:MAG: hypothetical protein GF331_13210 [Chitinivibrionales bacterium]|nr:hypothetical protein [Chitinivibrionales bacterium]